MKLRAPQPATRPAHDVKQGTNVTTVDREDPATPGTSDTPASTFPARLADVIGNSSVRAFARRASVSDTFLRQCLAGRTEPTRTKLLAIAEAGGVSVEWLATGQGTRTYGAAASVEVREPAGRPDRAILESVLDVVETALADAARPLTPAQKAQLICAVYDMHSDHHPCPLLPDQVRELMHAAH